MPALASTDPVALRLDADGDIDLTGDTVTFVAGLEGFVAGANARLRMVRGEWFADRGRGMPYRENEFVTADAALLGQPFDEGKARLAYTEAIAETPGFGAMVSMEITFDRTTRRMRVAWSARTAFGDTGPTVLEV